MENHITRTISNGAYWQINKHLHKQLGLRTTLLLQHFIDLQTKLFYGKEFFQSYTQIENELSLSEYHIKDSIKKLKDAGVITVEKKGMPAKNYYFVLLNRVEELLSLDSEKSPNKLEVVQLDENHLTSELKITEQVSEKLPNKLVENHPTYKRINNKSIKEKELKKETTTSSNSGSIKKITEKVLDILVNPEVDIKEYNFAIEDFNEIGGIDKVSEIMQWDENQKNNWYRKIMNVHQLI
jgi:DNA-binding Lrp family transcriptional regulator